MPQTVARSSASHAMKLLWSTEKNCYNFMYKDVKNRFMAISLEMCFVLVFRFFFVEEKCIQCEKEEISLNVILTCVLLCKIHSIDYVYGLCFWCNGKRNDFR